MIEVNERFEVPAPASTVWQLLADPHAVVGCVPGAAIVEELPDGTLETTLTVKFGPLAITFKARATLELDREQMRGRLTARGRDTQGGARFEASASFSVEEHTSEGGSIVVTEAQVDLSGRLASMIEGGAGMVVKRMSSEFANCLRARSASTPGRAGG
jgi:carbon monoxide dehydrogenase subunit G